LYLIIKIINKLIIIYVNLHTFQTNTNVDNTEQCNNILEAAALNNLQLNINNSSIIDSNKGNDNQIHKMSDNLSSTSSRQSEDYIVEGSSESYSRYWYYRIFKLNLLLVFSIKCIFCL